MRKMSWMIMGWLCLITAGHAETLLLDTNATGRVKFDLRIPLAAISQADWEDGEISLWVTAYNRQSSWTWSIPSRPEGLFLTDGQRTFPLLNPTNPEWGDLGPQAPHVAKELRFNLPPTAPAELRLVCPAGVMVWGGHPGGPMTVRLWKGLVCNFEAWVDAANRNVFIDASSAPASRYTYSWPGAAPVTSTSPLQRIRLPATPQPFDVLVRAFTRKDGVITQTVKVRPRAQKLQAPLPVEKILVGQCVYDHHIDELPLRDALITNNLANLMVGWSKASDYTNLPPVLARAMQTNELYFMTIYGGDTRATTRWFQERLGARYLWNNMGELAGYLYQGPKEAEACHVPQGLNLDEARHQFINDFIKRHVVRQHANYDFVFSTSGSALGTYELQGGMDFMCSELYALGAQNLAYATSEMRGAARKWQPAYWGGWLAQEWQTCVVPYHTPQKYALLKAGLYQQYQMGTSLIVLESGAQSTQAHKYTAAAENQQEGFEGHAPRAYRRTVKEFYDWVSAHPRATGAPRVNTALVLGNNDAYVGMYHGLFAIWAQHENARTNQNWRYTLPEQTWVSVQNLVFPCPPDALAPYPNHWLAGTPWGQVDVVNIDHESRLADLARYENLIYVGWNTMTDNILQLLAAYVRRGGNLLICLPHFSTRNDREHALYEVDDLIHGGNLAPLLELQVIGQTRAGELRLAQVLPRGRKVRVVESTPDGTPLVLEQRLGKGTVRLLTTWLYPARDAPQTPPYLAQVQHLLTAGQGALYISGDDVPYISYAVYDKVVYLLNIDCNRARTVTLHQGRRRTTIRLEPVEMRVVRQSRTTR